MRERGEEKRVKEKIDKKNRRDEKRTKRDEDKKQIVKRRRKNDWTSV